MDNKKITELKDFAVIDFMGVKWQRAVMASATKELCETLYKNFQLASIYVWAHYTINDESQLKYNNNPNFTYGLNKNDAFYILKNQDKWKRIFLAGRKEAINAYNNGFVNGNFKFDFEYKELSAKQSKEQQIETTQSNVRKKRK